MLGPPAAYHHGVSTTPSRGSSSRLPAAPGYTQTHKEQGLIPTASCCGGGSDAALDPAPPSMPTLDATAEVCVCLPRGRRDLQCSGPAQPRWEGTQRGEVLRKLSVPSFLERRKYCQDLPPSNSQRSEGSQNPNESAMRNAPGEGKLSVQIPHFLPSDVKNNSMLSWPVVQE